MLPAAKAGLARLPLLIRVDLVVATPELIRYRPTTAAHARVAFLRRRDGPVNVEGLVNACRQPVRQIDVSAWKSDRWRVVATALTSWKHTIRLCVILLFSNIPVILAALLAR